MGVISDAETAVIAALAAEGITCLGNESTRVKPPVATLWIDAADIGYLELDQGYGIGQMTWKLRHYVRLTQNEKAAYDATRSAIESIFQGLGADSTLGGAVRDNRIVDTSLYVAHDESTQPLLIFEATLTATLRPNVGG